METQNNPNIPYGPNTPPPPMQPQQPKQTDKNRKLKRWNIIVGIIDVILLLLLILWPKQCNRDDIDAAVEDAGGNIGYMGMIVVWNDDGQHISVDFDAHATEPSGDHIYFKRHNQNKGDSPTALGGYLDVDMLHNHHGTCVENILWPSKEKLADGVYQFSVNNFVETGYESFYDQQNRGFKAKIYVGDKSFTYKVNQSVPKEQTVKIADVTLQNGEIINIKHYQQPQEE